MVSENTPTPSRLTAETITDEQIRELFREERSFSRALLVETALGQAAGPCFRFPTEEEMRAARARCAAILNARKEPCP